MYTLKVILFLIVLTSASDHCSKDNHQGPFELTTPTLDFPGYNNLVLRATKIEAVGPAKLYIGYRSYWTSYCYNGGNLDSNTGCDNTLRNLPPSEKEVMTWIQKQKCEVGVELKDQWGSDSTPCIQPVVLGNWVNFGKEIDRRSNNNHFPYHTCNRSWRCGALVSDIPFVIEKTSKETTHRKGGSGYEKGKWNGTSHNEIHKDTIPATGLEENTTWPFGPGTTGSINSIIDHVSNSYDYQLAMNKPKKGKSKRPLRATFEPVFFTRKPRSVTELDDHYVVKFPTKNGSLQVMPRSGSILYQNDGEIAYLEHDIKVQESVHNVNCTQLYMADNTTSVICHDSRWGIFEDGECQGPRCFYVTRSGKSNNKPQDWKPASLDDLATLVKQINDRELLHFRDTLLLKNQIYQLENTVKLLVESAAKVDERLICSLFKKDCETEFLTKSIFYMRPCTTSEPVNTNCDGETIFKHGRWVKNTNPADCISFKNRQPLKLFEDIDIWMPQLLNISFHGTAENIPAWAFLVREQDSLKQTMEYTKYGGSTTSLQDVLNYPIGYLDSMLHTSIALPICFALLTVLGVCFVACLAGRRRV